MKSLLCFSDLHCHNYAQHSRRLPNGLNSRFEDCLNIIDQVISLVSEKDISVVVFLGDLFESRTTISVEVYSETFKAMRELANVCQLYMLVGNHDQWSRAGTVFGVEPFRELCSVIAEPTTEGPHGLGCCLHFIPHIADVETAKATLQNVPECDVLFMHQTFAEATAGPTDHKIKTKLSLDDVPWDRVKMLISGDIHKRQFHRGNRMHYVGSPLQLNFGERGEEKCFTLLDGETFEIEPLPTAAPKFYWPTAVEEAPALPEGADPDLDFIRLSYHERWQEAALELKRDYPRVELDLLKKQTKTQERINAEDLQKFGEVRLLEEWLRISEAAEDLDIHHALAVGLEELAEVSS